VLDGEQAEQQDVDDQGWNERPRLAAVDGFRHRQVAHEGNRIEEGDEEQQVGSDAVEHRNQAAGGRLCRGRLDGVITHELILLES
jgi:hypothetical protein